MFLCIRTNEWKDLEPKKERKKGRIEEKKDILNIIRKNTITARAQHDIDNDKSSYSDTLNSSRDRAPPHILRSFIPERRGDSDVSLQESVRFIENVSFQFHGGLFHGIVLFVVAR